MQSVLRDLAGYAVMIGFTAALVGACTLLVVRQRRSDHDRAWAPLIPLVGGTVRRRHVSSTMHGSWRGHAVTATVDAGGAETPAVYTLTISAAPGGADWEILYGGESLFGSARWYVRTGDERLRAALESSPAMAAVQQADPQPTIRYARSGQLTFEAENAWAPGPDGFVRHLDLLVRLDELNQRLNAPTPAA
ncbi:MAG TPA: hypothetical protein VF771_08695 [Longimicrobiaceae bacterium]